MVLRRREKFYSRRGDTLGVEGGQKSSIMGLVDFEHTRQIIRGFLRLKAQEFVKGKLGKYSRKDRRRMARDLAKRMARKVREDESRRD